MDSSQESESRVKSMKFLSCLLQDVSVGAENIASSIRSASSSIANAAFYDDYEKREQILWLSFDVLDLGSEGTRRVILIAYSKGFQIWDIEDANNIKETLSKRDGSFTFLRFLSFPLIQAECNSPLINSHPLLALVCKDYTEEDLDSEWLINQQETDSIHSDPSSSNDSRSIIRFYSLTKRTYVHKITFTSSILSMQCSPRIFAVALPSQIHCFETSTLEGNLVVSTYPSPQLTGLNSLNGVMALSDRWLAYASNNPASKSCYKSFRSKSPSPSPTSSASPSPSSSPSPSPRNSPSSPAQSKIGEVFSSQCAKKSSKHITAGIVRLGGIGYRKISRYWKNTAEGGLRANSRERRSDHANLEADETATSSENAFKCEDHPGVVMIRDVVTCEVIANFQAHDSVISFLSFDPTGTLLITNSSTGRTFHVYRLFAPSTNSNVASTHVHLYKLHRGVTPAIIQDVTFSNNSHWICATSSRGTSHVFAINPLGGYAALETNSSPPSPSPTAPSPSSPSPSSSPSILITNQHSSVLAYINNCKQQFEDYFTSHDPLINLSAVCRIRTNGILNWASSLTSSAFNAVASPTAINGAVKQCSDASNQVMTLFHSGSGSSNSSFNLKCIEKSFQQECVLPHAFAENLWVISKGGNLDRYHLIPFAKKGNENEKEKEEEEENCNTVFRMGVYHLDQLNLCRHLDWVEKEEFDINTSKKVVESMENNESFISNAEVLSQRSLPASIWSLPHVRLHLLLPQLEEGNISVNYTKHHELDIELMPCRAISVQKCDSLHMYDHINGFENTKFERTNSDNSENAFVHPYFLPRSSSANSSSSDQTINWENANSMNRDVRQWLNAEAEGNMNQTVLTEKLSNCSDSEIGFESKRLDSKLKQKKSNAMKIVSPYGDSTVGRSNRSFRDVEFEVKSKTLERNTSETLSDDVIFDDRQSSDSGDLSNVSTPLSSFDSSKYNFLNRRKQNFIESLNSNARNQPWPPHSAPPLTMNEFNFTASEQKDFPLLPHSTSESPPFVALESYFTKRKSELKANNDDCNSFKFDEKDGVVENGGGEILLMHNVQNLPSCSFSGGLLKQELMSEKEKTTKDFDFESKVTLEQQDPDVENTEKVTLERERSLNSAESLVGLEGNFSNGMGKSSSQMVEMPMNEHDTSTKQAGI